MGSLSGLGVRASRGEGLEKRASQNLPVPGGVLTPELAATPDKIAWAALPLSLFHILWMSLYSFFLSCLLLTVVTAGFILGGLYW